MDIAQLNPARVKLMKNVILAHSLMIFAVNTLSSARLRMNVNLLIANTQKTVLLDNIAVELIQELVDYTHVI